MHVSRYIIGIIVTLWLLLAATGCNNTRSPSITPPSPPPPIPTKTDTPILPDEPPLGAAAEFQTDFSIHSVPYREILSGGPPKDGIPALLHPSFISVQEADMWLTPREPVILFQIGKQARAYPIQILIWHEIVNDTVAGVPVAVTFCPLCNTAIAFDRRVDGTTLTFGTTGRLRFSNLIMYDRETESWWQQATGEAIVGKLTGKRLRFLPATIVAWDTFKKTYPHGLVLSRETGYQRPYGENPYPGYDSVDTSPFLYDGPPIPGQLPPKARVLTIVQGKDAVAYPYAILQEVGVVNDMVGDSPIVIFWKEGTTSPLDTSQIPDGRDVGTALAFSRRVGENVLTFYVDDKTFRDKETGSTWDITGESIAGPLRGRHLEPIVAINHFWFSWAAFRPETRIYRGE